jgi:Dna[CI] antecedent, DciA
MERAARVFRKAMQSRSLLSDDEVARAVWPAAVGATIAARTSRLRLVRNTLVVDVEDHVWQKQLHTLSGQILGRLNKLTPDLKISAIDFRIGVPRREPQSAASVTGHPAEAPLAASRGDEADCIQDPVLKKVYQISRRKASA